MYKFVLTIIFLLLFFTDASSKNYRILVDTINVKSKYNILGNGKVDETNKIQSAINSLPNGGVLFFPRGVYLISNIIINKPNITIIGEGIETFFLSTNTQPSLHNPTIWVINNDFTIKNIKISYKSWVQEGYKSLGIPRIDGNPWFGCHLAAGYNQVYDKKNSKKNLVYNGQKIDIVKNLLVDNVMFVGSSLHTVFLANTINSSIRNSTFLQSRATAIFGYGVGDIIISKNTFVSTVDDVIFLSASNFALNDVWTPLKNTDVKNVQIIDNKSYKAGSKVWCASGFNGVVIRNNYSEENRGDCVWTGEELSAGATIGSSNVIISDNIFNNAFGGFGKLLDGYPSQKDIFLDGTSYAAVFTNSGFGNNIKIINNIVNISPKVQSLNRNYYLFNIFDSNNIQIKNNKFNNVLSGGVIGRQTIDKQNIDNVVIEGNFFDGNPYNEFLSIFRGSSNVQIRKNIFNYKGYSAQNKTFIKCWENRDLYVENNVFKNSKIKIILGQGTFSNYRLKDNDIK